MWRIISFAILVFASGIQLAVSENSTCLPIPKTCTYYKDCLEPVAKCGSDGYPLGYGYRYCNVFQEYMDKFSPHGQQFLYDGMLCLQNALVPVSFGELSMNCTELRKFALNSHIKCYTQGEGNVCTLSFQDLSLLGYVIRKEFIDSENYPTFVKIFQFCGTHPEQLLRGQLNSLGGILYKI